MKPPRHFKDNDHSDCSRRREEADIAENANRSASLPRRLRILKPLLLVLAIGLLNVTGLAAAPDKIAAAPITLRNFKLSGDLSGGHATFTLTAIAHVDNSKGGSLDLLIGPVALTELGAHPKWRVRVDQNRYVLDFDRGGDFPVQLK